MKREVFLGVSLAVIAGCRTNPIPAPAILEEHNASNIERIVPEIIDDGWVQMHGHGTLSPDMTQYTRNDSLYRHPDDDDWNGKPFRFIHLKWALIDGKPQVVLYTRGTALRQPRYEVLTEEVIKGEVKESDHLIFED